MESEIPEEFYKYWNDAVNTQNYSSKLLIMFSAIEAMVRGRDKKTFPKPADLTEKILGKNLSDEIFAPGNGLRNRLVHGEYFKDEDANKNYRDLIHKKVLSYFNQSVLKEAPLELEIVNPQRHPFGNKEGGFLFLKNAGTTKVDLKILLAVIGKNGLRDFGGFIYVSDPAIRSNF